MQSNHDFLAKTRENGQKRTKVETPAAKIRLQPTIYLFDNKDATNYNYVNSNKWNNHFFGDY